MKDFAGYAKATWLTVRHDEIGWYATHDFGWLVKQMAKDGWRIEATGQTRVMPDDEVRTYFRVLKTFRNTEFVKRDYECTNIVACQAESAVAIGRCFDERSPKWVECDDSVLNGLTMLGIERGVRLYGYL